tara:strand:+ start:1390 stop:1629 length:240 start_codon:yes stop_codon:yes gene_type:complete
MKAPQFPSFFKNPNTKKFSFKPRYYNIEKERLKKLSKKERLSFTSSRNNKKNTAENQRKYKLIFLIIILSLLCYKLLIN